MAEKFIVTGEEIDRIDRKMCDIKRQLRLKDGSPLNPELVNLTLQDIGEGIFSDLIKAAACSNALARPVVLTPSAILFRKSVGRCRLNPLNGQVTIANSGKVFESRIDEKFFDPKINVPGGETGEIFVDIYGVAVHKPYLDAFSFINPDLDKLVFTQNQVVSFCKRYSGWIGDKGWTFFLVKKEKSLSATADNLFIAAVYAQGGKLGVHLYEFEGDDMWGCGERDLIVVPSRTNRK